MRRVVGIGRRIFAGVGVFALALAFSPGVVCLLDVDQASCCAGAMCPMHNARMNCGMTAHGAIQACGCHSVQYTGGLVFNCVAPPIFSDERAARAKTAVQPVAFPDVKLEIILPPPRFIS